MSSPTKDIPRGAGGPFACTHCEHDTSGVTDSRQRTDGNGIRRRRQCCACGQRFTTFEISAEEMERIKSMEQWLVRASKALVPMLRDSAASIEAQCAAQVSVLRPAA